MGLLKIDKKQKIGVIPTQAGISKLQWNKGIPAYAGMTGFFIFIMLAPKFLNSKL
ncbi:MAG: hypothetical protein LBN95_07210 [Prevotellaceae bacterium]|jgi:hypothetical protein|nr:hypothetical protein [Prevotellaceae bacterium]